MRSFLRNAMIYADNAATTRVSDIALEKMLPYLREQYGNASSQYGLGVASKRAIEHARDQVATAIRASPIEISFTSGGSEANSWVFNAVSEMPNEKPTHVVTSAIEHHSALEACRALEKKGIAVTYLPVDRMGLVSPDDLESAIGRDTRLISIMLANNETGVIQPVAEMARISRDRGIPFHTDAVQAVGHIPVDVNALGVDFLSASAHKFNGAKGIGFLYSRGGAPPPRIIRGGEQEHGFRAGTENTAGIVACGCAIEESVACMAEASKRLDSLASATASGIRRRIPGIRVNGEGAPRLPGFLNIGFDGASGDAMMRLLDLKGICVSAGSSCSSGKRDPSHVLKAMGQSDDEARSAVRISYGKYNSDDDAGAIASAICDAYGKIASALRR